MFLKIGVFKNLTNFTGEHLLQSLFLTDLQALRPTRDLKRLQYQFFFRETCKILKSTFLWQLLFKISNSNSLFKDYSAIYLTHNKSPATLTANHLQLIVNIIKHYKTHCKTLLTVFNDDQIRAFSPVFKNFSPLTSLTRLISIASCVLSQLAN